MITQALQRTLHPYDDNMENKLSFFFHFPPPPCVTHAPSQTSNSKQPCEKAARESQKSNDCLLPDSILHKLQSSPPLPPHQPTRHRHTSAPIRPRSHTHTLRPQTPETKTPTTTHVTMPPKKPSNATSTATTAALSDRDHQALGAAFKHNKNAFELDFEAYAAALGLANAASGRTNWSNLKKKLGVSGGECSLMFAVAAPFVRSKWEVY